jgi:hypothetical protein
MYKSNYGIMHVLCAAIFAVVCVIHHPSDAFSWVALIRKNVIFDREVFSLSVKPNPAAAKGRTYPC